MSIGTKTWVVAAALVGQLGWAAEPDEAAPKEDVAAASQNPISDLISVPLQLNLGGGIGAYQRAQFVLNFQPVIPIPITGSWTVIARLILPFVGQPDAAAPQGSSWGLGDFNPQLFAAVKLGTGFTLGFGPTLVIPTATEPATGTGKLSIGPSLVGVWTGGPFVVGALINNVWSVAGDAAGDAARPSVNQLFVQPIFNLNLPHHVFLVTSPQIIANWRTGDWVLPVGGGVGAILELGVLANVNLQAYWNAFAADGTPGWVVRLTIAPLFPTEKS